MGNHSPKPIIFDLDRCSTIKRSHLIFKGDKKLVTVETERLVSCRMAYRLLTLFKGVFIATQVTFTLIFIWGAVDNWEKYPSVTSVEIKNIEKEPFPAITVCYPNTWKWPGIINILSKWSQSSEDFFLDWHYGDLDAIFKVGLSQANVSDLSGCATPMTTNCLCPLINGIFTTPKEQKVGQFILYIIGQIYHTWTNISLEQRAEFEKSF